MLILLLCSTYIKLVKAKQVGYIESVGSAIALLQSKGMWLSDGFIRQALRLSGELP
ncbi:DUF3368 domain-containing protein [Iningainema tapete]|uniref:DUF3368 domain-containing protein n=1 Tax=Iningainema tapete BLCC-T55 TaxID=2748662 RepID=A0A8J6XR92_9CYAN|nr:DUF3368 domain-containing protein [Iningainema tapete]MBD2775986.1 DUF3368 domain-containing protein [Iningainema tapete BLCC-T55]